MNDTTRLQPGRDQPTKSPKGKKPTTIPTDEERRGRYKRLAAGIVGALTIVGPAGLPSPANAGGGNSNEVVLCHIPPGNPENRHTIMVSESAAATHHRHGDPLGYCDSAEEPLPPGAFADFAHAITGQSFSYNVLANDALGNPPATITALTGFDANHGCGDFSFDLVTGVVAGTSQPGSGSCGVFSYTLSNSSGQSTAIVLITVTFN